MLINRAVSAIVTVASAVATAVIMPSMLSPATAVGVEIHTAPTQPQPSVGRGAVRPAAPVGNCTIAVRPEQANDAVNAARRDERICVIGGLDRRMVIRRTTAEQPPIELIGDGTSTIKGISVTGDNINIENFNSAGSAPGIAIEGHNILLRNNTVHRPAGGDGDGLRFFGANIRIAYNTFSDMRNTGGAHADCMQTFADDSPPSQHVIIDNNRCERVANQCLMAEGPNDGEGDGVGHTHDITFSRNYCEAHASQAVMLEDIQRATIVFNEIHGDLDKAFAFSIGSTEGRVAGNWIAPNIRYEVGIDASSLPGYQGPNPGGPP